MQINLGIKIRELRRRDGRTQEALADALGVTSQAVSRWESGGSYPDINLLPSLANYFGITIDELFGYEGNREQRIDEMVSKIQELLSLNKGIDVNIDKCLALARDAMIEYPGEEKLMLCRAQVLYKAGGVRYGEAHLTDPEGYSIYDTERHKGYAEWNEAIKLYEKALPMLTPGPLYHRTVDALSQLYVNMGYHEKAMALAETAPDIFGTREFLQIYACDGKQQAKAYGEALLKTSQACASLIVLGTLANDRNMSASERVQSIRDAIGLFDRVCSNGNYGKYANSLANMNMLLSAYLWLDGKKDEAFDTLDIALSHAENFEKLCSGETQYFTEPLLRLVEMEVPATAEEARRTTMTMAEDWPWWDFPKSEAIKAQMQADTRWDMWCSKLVE